MTLTEQWEKGELKTGDYYVKPRNGQVFVYHINHSVKHIYHNHAGEIKEVLAEVPTFEELRANQKWIKSLEEKIKIYERKDKQATETSIAYNELVKKNEELKEILERHKKATAKAQIRSCDLEIINQRLKELLRECRELYDELNYLNMVEKIDNAIGEKK